MLGNDYPDQNCSVARALEVVGERWTLLILRDVLLGLNRFDELVGSLAITRSVRTARLTHLVDHGVLVRHRYQQRPDRFSYHVTPKGEALFGVIALLMQWGDRYYPHPAGPPRLLLHRGCGGRATEWLTCQTCDQQLRASDIDTPPSRALLAPSAPQY